MRNSTLPAVLVALCFSPNVAAQSTAANPSVQLSTNAAVKYLRADVALRQAYDLPPDAAIKFAAAIVEALVSESYSSGDTIYVGSTESLTPESKATQRQLG